eukprot:1601902-Amphidinium_carterae.1
MQHWTTNAATNCSTQVTMQITAHRLKASQEVENWPLMILWNDFTTIAWSTLCFCFLNLKPCEHALETYSAWVFEPGHSCLEGYDMLTPSSIASSRLMRYYTPLRHCT